MKATAPPAKRRRGPRLAVLALVFCSLLVPIAFLFNRFPAGESSVVSPSWPPDLGGMQASAQIGSVPCHTDLFLGALFPV
jgi:alpha-1,4-galacturonosyltransferase